MVRWNVTAIKERGVGNAFQLAARTQLTYPVCWRIFSGEAVDRVNVATLETVATALGVKDPLSLLEYRK